MDKQWIKELKVGDEVIVESGGWRHHRSIEKVEKINKVTIRVCGSLFSIDSGYERGDGWHMATLYQCTPQAKEELRIEREKDRIASHLIGFPWSRLSYENLLKVYNIVKESEK